MSPFEWLYLDLSDYVYASSLCPEAFCLKPSTFPHCWQVADLSLKPIGTTDRSFTCQCMPNLKKSFRRQTPVVCTLFSIIFNIVRATVTMIPRSWRRSKSIGLSPFFFGSPGPGVPPIVVVVIFDVVVIFRHRLFWTCFSCSVNFLNVVSCVLFACSPWAEW